MRALFAATLFCSAALLFLVQPMVGKMVLPYLGGGPAVWNTCVVFFQAVLLLGYLYAHKLASLPGTKRQLLTHLGVLGIGATALVGGLLFTTSHSALPVLASLAPTGDGVPVLNLLAMLAVAVGLPLFGLSASAPLLQKWFAATGHPSAKDPYFLYAASNAGSLLFLLGYPLVLEPTLRVVEQTWLFAGGFVLLLVFTTLCGKAALNPLRPPSLMVEPPPVQAPLPPTTRDKFHWLLLAFVPSSLMLGVTTHLTTDIAAIPLLWVLPLSLYLLTFIVAFSKGAERLRGPLNSIAPIVILLLVFVLTSQMGLPLGLLILAHTAAYFVIALTLHSELAAARPHPAYLTNFYLWVSIGGVVGGVLNGLIAPLLFPLPFEYGAAIVVACLLLRRGEDDTATPTAEPDPKAGSRRMVDLLVPFAMVILCMALRVVMNMKFADQKRIGQLVGDWLTGLFHFSGLPWVVDGGAAGLLLTFGPPCLLAFACADRPLRFTLAVLAILFVFYLVQWQNPATKVIARTYFGVLFVQEGDNMLPDGTRRLPAARDETKFRQLLHGTTLHGSQFPPDAELDQSYPGLSQAPLMYYHRTGPVGDLFLDTNRRHAADARVGMVGLGTGATAAYMGAGQSITFYEIDPKVVELVDGPKAYFTFLHDARDRGATVNRVLGDARLTLAQHDGPAYHLLILDAFSSDAIPLHLMTVEAMRLYAERVTTDGLIGIHISNRYIDLAPVVAALAKECGLSCRLRTEKCEDDKMNTLPDTPPGKTSSSWMVLGRSEEAMATFDRYNGPFKWERVEVPDGLQLWTDDYADVLAVMKAPEVKWLRRVLGQPSFAR